jgi:hypothetical protein
LEIRGKEWDNVLNNQRCSRGESVANELIKTTSEIAGALGLTEFGKRVIGPSLDEIGERLRGRVKRLFDKAEPMVVNAGITSVQAVPPKLLLPILEGASVEDDETLHDMWAALLANAASPENANKVRPGFLAVLMQMAPDEAAILNWMVGRRTGPLAGSFNKPFDYGELMEAYKTLGFEIVTPGESPGVDSLVFETCLQNLEAEKLIEVSEQKSVPGFVKPRALTYCGLSFVTACRPPKRKA